MNREEIKPKIFRIIVYRCKLVQPRVEIRSWNWVPERVRALSLARLVVLIRSLLRVGLLGNAGQIGW